MSPRENNDRQDSRYEENDIPIKMSKDGHLFEGSDGIIESFMDESAIYPIAKISDIEQK